MPNDQMEPAFSPRLLMKVLVWGFGQHGFRVCHSCVIKQQITLEQVAEWIKGAPDCGRCKGPTELMREDQAPKIAEYRAVASTPSAPKPSQRSTVGTSDGVESATSADAPHSNE